MKKTITMVLILLVVLTSCNVPKKEVASGKIKILYWS